MALWGSAVHAEPPSVDVASALDPMSRQIYREARSAEQEGALERAAAGYRVIIRSNPSFTPARLDLGRVLRAAGRDSDAESVYVRAPIDEDVLGALGQLYMDQSRWEDAARQFAKLCALPRPEGCRLEAVAVAYTDPLEGGSLFQRYLNFPVLRQEPKVIAESALVVVEALRAEEHVHEAGALLTMLIDQIPESLPHVESMLDRQEMEEQARRLAASTQAPLTGQQRTRLE